MRRRAKPAKAKAEATLSVAPRSRKNGAPTVRDLEKRLAEALEQQTATAEILNVISSSPTDLQPVLDAVAQNAARLCEGFDATIFRRDGDRLRLVAHHGPIPAGTIGEFSLTLVRGTVGGRSVLEGRTVHVADMQTESDEFPEGSEHARRWGHRTILSVPLMREGVAIGVIQIRRTESQLFTERQVALLQTFADQAVIAIENARLFQELQGRNRELTESLEQQTATAEILRVISSSPTDLQPVMDVVAESAARFCGATQAAIWRLEGDSLQLVATHGSRGARSVSIGDAIALSRRSVAGRAALDRQTIHVPDLEALPQTEFPETLERTRRIPLPTRTVLATPLLREGVPIGVVYMRRSEVQPFTDKQIELLKTFANQAVIAIENVRLFTELQEKNRALTTAHAQISETLDQQTATSEVLRVISSSPTAVEPVFDAILQSAVRLCDGLFGVAYRFDGERIHVMAHHNQTAESLEALRRAFSVSADDTSVTGRTIHTRRAIQIVDALAEDTPPVTRELARKLGFRSVLSVPMLREQRPMGAIAVARREQRPFRVRHRR
jgi:two-component system NtrC family sensor kinase